MATCIFLTAHWQNLLMLNYAIDPELLQPHVPRGTKLDQWHGQTYVSMVGFMFLNTKVLGIPIPGHRNFEEVNLRFYVLRETPQGVRRGVVFIKEIVPRRAIAAVARTFYEEPYVAYPMKHSSAAERPSLMPGDNVGYSWKSSSRWNSLTAKIIGAPEPIPPNSEAEFITEHYWGYTKRGDGSTSEYQVEHPRWEMWPVTAPTFECDVEQVYGAQFIDVFAKPCTSAFVATGSSISVRIGERI